MDAQPVSLTAALSSFQETYSPRIVAMVSDYAVKIAHASGEHVWHVHADTDEFILVLDKPSSPGGSILMFEPAQTQSTGDWHEGDIPGHVHSTTGAEL